ncbi:odorant receptor 82a-like [Copidosoma floridanum]|uniref:odorant receptor 82a-like n=1 Tax=Copidosoma floridanum TaxID=29053 RepID=UPI0006C9ADFA|nr:odorant receptor 82a-like [Copidosoma floridanum]
MSVIIRHVEICLKVVGLWHDSTNSFGFYLVILCLISHMPFQLWHAVVVRHNFEALMANLSVLMTISAAVVKLIAFRLKGRNVRYVVKEMMDDWINENHVSNASVMKEQMNRGNYLTKWLIGAYNGVVILYMINVVTNYSWEKIEKRAYIMPAKYPVTWKRSPNYEIVVSTQFIAGLLSNNSQAMIEGLLTILVLHVGTKVHILKRELAIVSEVCQLSKDKKLTSKAMKLMINKHLNFIDFIEKIKDIYFYVSFFHVLIFTLLHFMIAYILLDAFDKGDSSMKIFMYGLFTTRSLFSTMIHCACGEYLINQGKQFVDDLNNVQWYEFSNTSDKRAISFILMKAQKPICLTPAKFGYLSYNYLSGIIRTSYSFLSLVRVSH